MDVCIGQTGVIYSVIAGNSISPGKQRWRQQNVTVRNAGPRFTGTQLSQHILFLFHFWSFFSWLLAVSLAAEVRKDVRLVVCFSRVRSEAHVCRAILSHPRLYISLTLPFTSSDWGIVGICPRKWKVWKFTIQRWSIFGRSWRSCSYSSPKVLLRGCLLYDTLCVHPASRSSNIITCMGERK